MLYNLSTGPPVKNMTLNAGDREMSGAVPTNGEASLVETGPWGETQLSMMKSGCLLFNTNNNSIRWTAFSHNRDLLNHFVNAIL